MIDVIDTIMIGFTVYYVGFIAARIIANTAILLLAAKLSKSDRR